jgi:predicted nucleic acid-binding protein
VSGTTYDTGVLLAAEAGRPDVWTRHERMLIRRETPVVPTVVLAQAWRGGRQARLSRLLQKCRIEDFEESAARATGVALAASATRDIMDAAVVVSALSRGDRVDTCDPQDLLQIAGAIGRRLDVRPV